jgi:hypothetical protein
MNIRAFGRLLFSGFALPKLAFRESNFLPESKPKSLFEALRSKRFVRRMGVGLVLVMGSTFAALQAVSVDTGASSTIDNYLLLNQGVTNQTALHPDINFTNGQTSGTWEAWVYPTKTTAGGEAIFSKEDNYVLGIYNGKLWAYFQNNGWTGATYEYSLVKDAWSHVAFVKNGTQVLVYVNGREVVNNASGAYSTLSTLNTAGDYHRFRIGNRQNGEAFSGRIDEARIWDDVRTGTEILDNMHGRVSGDSQGLQGYWDFNEPSGNLVYDRTIGYNQTLTLQNSPTRVDVKQITLVSGGDTVITFPRTYLPGVGGWTAPTNAGNFRALVVGGGGGGGAPNDSTGWSAGGGGAGGLKNLSSLSLSGVQTIKVGQGGNGGLGQNQRTPYLEQSSGQGSQLGTNSVSGGGRGGGGYLFGDPQTGGSGGGGRMYNSNAGANGVAGEGNRGGNGAVHHSAGGGGGAGGAGGNGTSTNVGDADGGAGGAGVSLDISGTSRKYAWGGSGAGWRDYGLDWNTSLKTAAITPAANTGAGGGGGRHTPNYNNLAGSGASGVVIVRYSPTVDLAWNKNSADQEYAYRNDAGDPVMPIGSSAAWTLEFWVKPDTISNTWSPLIGQQSNVNEASQRNVLWLLNGVLYLVTPAQDVNSGFTLQAGKWTHLAWVMIDATNSELYVDGRLVWKGTLSRTNSSGTFFTIGGSRQTGYNSLDGNIDQVKVWGSALSSSQITNTMHSHGTGFSGAPSASCSTGLRAHYDFNEFVAGSVSDRSGCGRDLLFNSSVGNSYSESYFTSAAIVETGTAHSLQNYVKFNRSYLTAAGGWTPPSGVSRAKGIVVAGGGGGGAWVGGGGGAGGVSQITETAFSGGAVSVTVGQGGRGARWDKVKLNMAFGVPSTLATASNGSNGQSTSIGSISATGGGKGASWNDTPETYFGSAAGSGGSGGGGVGYSARTDAVGAAGIAGQGFAGGSGVASVAFLNGGGGGAGGPGSPGQLGTSRSGNGGLGITTYLTGPTGLSIAGGGGGGEHQAASGAPGTGSFGGGNGAQATDTQAGSGQANTGGGGGGSGGASVTYNSHGGDGGSGVVILSFGSNLEVTRTATAARAGSNFAQPIQVTAGNGAAEHDVTVTATGQVLRVGNSGAAVTSVTVRTVGGVATFTDLGFTSNVGVGARSLTFTSDAFVGTTLTITPSQTASTVNITSSGSTTGTFVNGQFESSTDGTANILNTDLQTHMQTFSTTVESRGTISVQANISSTAVGNGLTLRATGRITVTAGASSASPRLIGTASGPITFWTTGSDGGVTLGNFTQLNTIQSGSAGAEITIGGGLASSSDATRPSGFAQSSEADGISLGTSATVSGVVMRAGSGNISLSGEHTSTGAHSGIDIFPGIDLVGSQVTLRGITGYNISGTGAAGISSYISSAIKSLIHATGSFGSPTPALQISSSSASSTGALLGPQDTATDSLTLRVSGDNAGVSITGTTSRAASTGLWLASVAIEVKNGPTTLDSGDDMISLGRDSGRTFTYRPTNGGLGGDITIRSARQDDTPALSIQTAGTVSFLPTATSFTAAVSFPTSGSTVSVGNLVVGTSNNTADLTVGSALTSASEVTYRGGSITVSGNVTSTNGTAAFYSTGASKSFTKTTATITAAQDVIISSVASTVSTGSGAISAAAVRLSSSSTMTSGAPITSRGVVEISSSAGNTTVSGGVNSAGDLSIVGGDVAVNAAQTTTNSRNITISPRTAYTGSGTLNSSGTLTISGGSSVGPTNAIQATGNITVSGSGNFTNSGASITSSSGNVSITTSGSSTAVVSANVQATTGSIAFNTGGAYSGAGTLTAGTTVAVTSAGVTIGGNVWRLAMRPTPLLDR